MPEFSYPLANGKTLVLEGATEPSPDIVQAEAQRHGVQLAPKGTNPQQPTAKQSSEPGMIKLGIHAIPGILADVGKGAAKGIADTAVGAGEMIHKIPGVSTAVDALYGTPGLSQRAFPEAHKELAPQNTSERAGGLLADVGMMFAPNVGSIKGLGAVTKLPGLVESAGKAALMSGAQSGGDPVSMAEAGALAGGGELASGGLTKMAGMLRKGQAGKVADVRTARLAKGAGETMDDPMWMAARNTNEGQYADLMKRYGLTGAEDDIAKISRAPARDQEVLSALSRQLGKSRPLGHEWSLFSALAGALGYGAGGATGMGVVAPAILASSLIKKYPGQTARGLDALATAAPKIGQGLAGLPGGLHVDPMTEALLKRENP